MTGQITTKHILNKYDISRQSLYNWINEGLVDEPDRDWRGWRIWTDQILNQIETLILSKSKEHALSKSDISQPLEISNRRYLGSKQKLVDFIHEIIELQVDDFTTFFEPFGGTGVISNHYNNAGKNIIINDILFSNYVAYSAFFANDSYDIEKIKTLIGELNHAEIMPNNYYAQHYGNKYFTLENAAKIGAIRDLIDKYLDEGSINNREKHILITSLLYAADKSANTCGHYDAYRETLDSLKPLELLVPNINNQANGNNQLFNMDANQLARTIVSDVTYIDTPYNSRQYGDAYHLLENIATNLKPEVMGKAGKMIDRKHIKSDYCTANALIAFEDLIGHLNTKHILVSYNNMAKKGNGRSNAKISNEEIIDVLSTRGPVQIFETNFNAFTTGKSKIQDHKELIYYVKVQQEIPIDGHSD